MLLDITKNRKDSLSTDWNHHPGSKENPTNIISPSQINLNPLGSNLQNNTSQNLVQSNTILPPKTDLEWLEELKRKRKKFGWWG